MQIEQAELQQVGTACQPLQAPERRLVAQRRYILFFLADFQESLNELAVVSFALIEKAA